MEIQGIILKNKDGVHYGEHNDEAQFTCYSTSERSTTLTFKIEVPKEIKDALFAMAEKQMKQTMMDDLNDTE